jgi:hypothetical protein
MIYYQARLKASLFKGAFFLVNRLDINFKVA